ncbi:MAG: EthD domain-containing protein [Candidatus Sulfotelmatobacter sp.]
MIKLVYCITKKPGLTDEEFFHYWQNIHGPIGARIPHLRKLTQSHRITIPGDTRPPDFDGTAELWFDDVDALIAARKSPEWKTSSDDEVNFIDPNRVAYFISQERIILQRDPGPPTDI